MGYKVCQPLGFPVCGQFQLVFTDSALLLLHDDLPSHFSCHIKLQLDILVKNAISQIRTYIGVIHMNKLCDMCKSCV